MKIKSIRPTALLNFWQDLIRQFFRNQGILNASALTYTTLFAVVPLVTVSYTMLATIPTFQGAGDVIQQWVLENFVPATGEVVHQYLSDFTAQARRLTAVGVVFLVITSIMMMKNIEAALNRIWRVAEPRKGVSSFLLYWAVLSLGPLLIGLGLVVTSYIAALPVYTSATDFVGPGRVFSLLPILFSAVAFMLLYCAVPNCSVPLLNALLGGVFAALMFELSKRGFAFFVTQFPSYELIYGAFAAVPLFLAWIFISWIIILLGAELSRALTIYQVGRRTRRRAHLFVVLHVLRLLWQAQQQGQSLTATELLTCTPGLGQEGWDRYLPLLMQANLLSRTAEGSYLLSRDLQGVTLHDLAGWLPWPVPEVDLQGHAEPWEALLNERLSALSDAKKQLLDIQLSQLFTDQAKQ
ncbi:MAG: YihY family inner membrane protein [Nitrincola lacisaponensis]|uniref:YihY family inner membrane protein n=1 Tax=Nitrincola lacisaponensis TaxID=267850 RepID=UPI00391B5BE8